MEDARRERGHLMVMGVRSKKNLPVVAILAKGDGELEQKKNLWGWQSTSPRGGSGAAQTLLWRGAW
jgi:hypothetical protein